MLLILVLGGAWYLVSRLNAASANRTVLITNQNAAVLAQAKQALLGYVAHGDVESGVRGQESKRQLFWDANT